MMALFFCCLLVCGQKEYKGRLLDSETNLPLPYVNIGIVDKGIGTVSDEKGLFHFDLSSAKISDIDEILFSVMGYESLLIPVKNITLVYNDYVDVFITPAAFELKEVVVSNKGEWFIKDNIGYRNFGEKNYGYWKDNIALGGELATRIIAKSGLRKLKKFEFEVWHNPSDSLLLRVNIYEDDGKMGRPGTSLNTSGANILCTVNSDDKMVQVDLSPYDVYVKDDFVVSLELLKVYGDKELGLVLSATFNNYGSYRKSSSQDKWEYLSDLNMAYYVASELMVSEKEAQRFELRVAKKKEKTTHAIWFCDYAR
ncbi:carboxypeptidase-like regulatory domain-containing protein [uncultured Croceitalea sp.]|uniref:carboxypeptidase-like regulatory domain-containing protein n=1 Tax=uncultured Croceitalea sp. TaxID=1798908 RepID=UPI0033063F9B